MSCGLNVNACKLNVLIHALYLYLFSFILLLCYRCFKKKKKKSSIIKHCYTLSCCFGTRKTIGVKEVHLITNALAVRRR